MEYYSKGENFDIWNEIPSLICKNESIVPSLCSKPSSHAVPQNVPSAFPDSAESPACENPFRPLLPFHRAGRETAHDMPRRYEKRYHDPDDERQPDQHMAHNKRYKRIDQMHLVLSLQL
jgi:hypothetical protein